MNIGLPSSPGVKRFARAVPMPLQGGPSSTDEERAESLRVRFPDVDERVREDGALAQGVGSANTCRVVPGFDSDVSWPPAAMATISRPLAVV